MSDAVKKYLQPVIIALSIAIISAAGASIYRHETMLINQARDLGTLKKNVYRLRMRNYEYHSRYVRAEIQIMELMRNKTGQLSVVEQTRLSFLEDLKEQIQEDRTQAAEEGQADILL